ncbi:TIGR03905 family protein [Candidatus Epulonipiscioides gigas]|nr:TIGR03905 family protein [Epulopiscium sp. SCG-C07WGA-EpuloA2]ONI44850.1 TIGR03905 family protein [Epulopiscium sp. SCG-C07WGA-EpuloA2]
MNTFKTQNVCAREIKFDVKDNKIKEIQFVNGCPGNTFGLAQVLVGMDVDDAITRLKGIDCKGRGTSCPDQLAQALEKHKNIL